MCDNFETIAKFCSRKLLGEVIQSDQEFEKQIPVWASQFNYPETINGFCEEVIKSSIKKLSPMETKFNIGPKLLAKRYLYLSDLYQNRNIINSYIHQLRQTQIKRAEKNYKLKASSITKNNTINKIYTLIVDENLKHSDCRIPLSLYQTIEDKITDDIQILIRIKGDSQYFYTVIVDTCDKNNIYISEDLNNKIENDSDSMKMMINDCILHPIDSFDIYFFYHKNLHTIDKKLLITKVKQELEKIKIIKVGTVLNIKHDTDIFKCLITHLLNNRRISVDIAPLPPTDEYIKYNDQYETFDSLINNLKTFTRIKYGFELEYSLDDYKFILS